MTFKITTVYADGRVEERDATAEEVAEHDAQIARIKEAEREIEELEKSKQAAKESAIAKLSALGLTAEEAAAIVGV